MFVPVRFLSGKIASMVNIYKLRGCETKKQYLTKQEALEVAGKKAKKTGLAMTVYPCRYCHAWHIARKKKFSK